MGIKIHDLLESDIFCHQFEYDDWPNIHLDNNLMCMPYNDSKFALRGKYTKVFSCFDDNSVNIEKKSKSKEEEANEEISNVKIYKIKYTINVLPGLIASCEQTGEDESSFMELLS